VKPIKPRIQAIKAGSSSIRVTCLHQILEGGIERIGLPDTMLLVKSLNQTKNVSRSMTTPDHTIAVGLLMDCIERRSGRDGLTAAGHWAVHGGPILEAATDQLDSAQFREFEL
jgi:acetate kinase